MYPIQNMVNITKTRLTLAVVLGLGTTAMSAPPDLTNGGVPGDSITFNLGPTGARGWTYHVRENTSESRQILVKQVAAGSPANGILEVNDVILGADGTGAPPVNFSSDARKILGLAIGAVDARTPATLSLIRWRAGVTDTVTLTLRTMGAYSSTAPYTCPKSAKILQEGLQYLMANETAGKYSFGTLSLPAANNHNPADPDNTARMARARTEVRALIPTAATMTQMMSDARDAISMVTWQRGHTLIVLAEYFLATNDTLVLPAIEAYAVNIAKNSSLFGTMGHIFAEKNLDGSANGPMGGQYGPVNSTGITCFLGLLLARECGLANPEITPAIDRMSRFYAYYADRGSVPYGEHEPYPHRCLHLCAWRAQKLRRHLHHGRARSGHHRLLPVFVRWRKRDRRAGRAGRHRRRHQPGHGHSLQEHPVGHCGRLIVQPACEPDHPPRQRQRSGSRRLRLHLAQGAWCGQRHLHPERHRRQQGQHHPIQQCSGQIPLRSENVRLARLHRGLQNGGRHAPQSRWHAAA